MSDVAGDFDDSCVFPARFSQCFHRLFILFIGVNWFLSHFTAHMLCTNFDFPVVCIAAFFIRSHLLLTVFVLSLSRGGCMCLQRTASGHSKGQDADLSHTVPGLHPLLHVHLQTSGSARPLPGHHAGTDGQHCRELCAVHELRFLPAGRPLHIWTAQWSCAEVGAGC